MKKYLYLSLLLFMFGCERQIKIDNHFKLSTFDTNDLSLIFLDENNYMFTVVEPNVVGYLKCNNHIYIVQHPLDAMGKPDGHSQQYYIIDSNLDYSDERAKPHSVSQSRFDEMLKMESGERSLNRL